MTRLLTISMLLFFVIACSSSSGRKKSSDTIDQSNTSGATASDGSEGDDNLDVSDGSDALDNTNGSDNSDGSDGSDGLDDGTSADGPIDGVSIDEASCIRFEPLATKTGVPNQGTVAVAFSLVTCDGEGVFGLKAEDLLVKENDDVISATESQAMLIEGVDLRKKVFVTLLLDNSPSVAANGALNDAVEAAQTFANKLFDNDSVNTYISVAFFSKSFQVKQAFTNDQEKVLAAIQSLQNDTTGSNTTNLYGAMLQAMEASDYIQSQHKKDASDGLITVGELVVFTDGKDQAGLHSLGEVQSALSSTTDGATVISFGGELAPDVLESLGKSSSHVANAPSQLLGVFEKVADLLNSETVARYVLAYCSPKLGGNHTLTLEIAGKDGQLLVPFDASEFNGSGPECSLAAIESACKSASCGGLWCGGCGKHGMCLADQTCTCMDNATGENCETCAPGWTGTDCTECTLGDDCPILFTSLHAKRYYFPGLAGGGPEDGYERLYCGRTIEGDIACFNPWSDEFMLEHTNKPIVHFLFESESSIRDFRFGIQPLEAGPPHHRHHLWYVRDDDYFHCPLEECPTGRFRSIDGGGMDDALTIALRSDGRLVTRGFSSQTDGWHIELDRGPYISAFGPELSALKADGTNECLAMTGTQDSFVDQYNYWFCTNGNFTETFPPIMTDYPWVGITQNGSIQGPAQPFPNSPSVIIPPPSGERFRFGVPLTKGYGFDVGCGILEDASLHCWNNKSTEVTWIDVEAINETEKRTFRTIIANRENLSSGTVYGLVYGLTTAGRVVKVACADPLGKKHLECEKNNHSMTRGQFNKCSINTEQRGFSCNDCKRNFGGDDCNGCKGNWDGPSCNVCKPNWAGANCDVCNNGWEGEQCNICGQNWTGDNCDVPRATTLACGPGDHACILTPEGVPHCWGEGNAGQLEAPPMLFSSIWTGWGHTCGLKANGVPECWGTEEYLSALPTGPFLMVSDGSGGSCGLRLDGSIECWGGPSSYISNPPTGAFSTLDAGGQQACGIRIDGTIKCWGKTTGEIPSLIVLDAPTTGTFQSVSVGTYHACAIKMDQTLACWGNDAYDLTTAPGGTFQSVDAGGDHTCGLRTDGSAICWGNNLYGKTDAPDLGFSAICSANQFSCGADLEGVTYCWGNAIGQPNWTND